METGYETRVRPEGEVSVVPSEDGTVSLVWADNEREQLTVVLSLADLEALANRACDLLARLGVVL